MAARPLRQPAAAIAALALLAVTAGAGAGQSPPAAARAAPVGPDFLISGLPATGNETAPAVAYSSSGGEYLVVWSATPPLGGQPDVYGRRVSAAGAPIGDAFRISGPGATADEHNPAVAYNAGTNEYLVVWRDARDYWTGRGFDIYGRRVSGAGTPLGPDVRLSSAGATADEQQPAVASNGTAYLVAWSDYRGGAARDFDIYGQAVSGAGSRQGPNFRISGQAATTQDWAPAVASDGTDYLVAWSDYRGGGPRGTDIYGRRVSAEGATVGADFRISPPAATTPDTFPAVAWDGAEYLVVWQDNRDGATRGQDVYGRRVSAAGAPLAAVRVSPSAALGDDTRPAAEWNGTGYLVVWEDRRDADTRARDTYGRVVPEAGVPSEAAFRISVYGATAEEFQPAVACSGADCLVVWEDWRDEATRGSDIRGRLVSG